MTAYIVREPFKAKIGEIKKGQIVSVPEDTAKSLLAAGKIAEIDPCPNCHEYAWWLSIHGVLVCGCCHPPMPGTIKKWVGDSERYSKMKGSKPAVLLSWEEARQRKAGQGR
jgi:hypothetical protein